MVAWVYGVGIELARSVLLRARGGAPPPSITGVSGGAIAALLLATDVDLALDGAFWTLNGENMRRATKHKELSTRDAMRETLDAVLPRDAPALASARVGLTVVAAHGPMRAWPARPPIMIGEFRDCADLLDAISASFHIPLLRTRGVVVHKVVVKSMASGDVRGKGRTPQRRPAVTTEKGKGSQLVC